MMSGWTGRVYQTAWTLDFASERSDAKSYVRNRQDGPDIIHLKRTENVRIPRWATLTAPGIPFIPSGIMLSVPRLRGHTG